MPPTQLTVEVGQDSGGVTTIICEGELDLATVSQLAEALAWSFTADLRRLHIDATKVSFCDSAGLRCLLHTAYQCHRQGARLELVASDPLARTLRLCGLPTKAKDGALVAELTDALTDTIAAKVTRSHAI